MADTANSESLVFNLSRDPNHPRCKVTGRLFELGSGALPFDQQSANFIAEQNHAADRPTEGERCIHTNREFQVGSGALSKTAQSRQFLSELSPAEKLQRASAATALNAMPPAGSA
jgi:hypothetical protein